MKRTFIAIALFGCLVLALPGQSSALSPADPVVGEVVFSNGGRIVSISADGSQRKILTRRKTRVGTRQFGRESLGFGDQQPAISPDGRQIAFLRSSERDGVFTERLMVGARDGSSLEAVLSFRNSFLSTVDWSAGGKLVVTLTASVGRDEKGREVYQQRLLELSSDGRTAGSSWPERPGLS